MNHTQINVFKKPENPFFNATMVYLIIMVAFVGVRIFGQFGLLNFLGDFEDLAYSLIIQVGIIFGLTLVLYKMFTGKSVKAIFKEFNFKPISFKAVLLCIGISVCLIIFNTAFNSIYTMILQLFGYSPASSTITSYPLSMFLVALFASAVLPAFCEEFANRGMLLNGLKKLGVKKAIVISGLLFALMHLNVGQFGYAFMVGMFFAFVCIATGSIVPGIIMHFLNNGIVEYLTFARVNNLPLGNYYEQFATLGQGDFLSSIFLIFIALFAIMFLFAWFTYLLIKDCQTRKLNKLGNEIYENLSEADLKPENGMLKINLSPKMLGMETKQTYFPTLKAKIPLYLTICLGTIITVMTLIWSAI
ncbi:MAG: lysostaphin resistance A-like protein [Clostridia bacterium]